MTIESKAQKNIETRGYVASKADIVELVTNRVSAMNVIGSSNDTYLKILIATAQDTLGLDVKRAGHNGNSQEIIDMHVQTVTDIHKTFYRIMVDTANGIAPEAGDTRDMNVIVNARCAFARSTYSTLRSWMIRGKHTLKHVVAKTASKTALYEATPKDEVRSASRVLNRKPILKATERILTAVVDSSAVNRQIALETLHDVMTVFSRGFDNLGINADKLREAIEHTFNNDIIDLPAERVKKQRQAA